MNTLFSLDQSIVILHQSSGLMFMSDTFLLSESKKEHLSSQGKHFLFHFKSFFFLEILIFQRVRTLNFMAILNASTWNKKYVLLNSSEIKLRLVMKFCAVMSYYKKRIFIEKLHRKYDLETRSRPFCVYTKLSATLQTSSYSFLEKIL